MVLKRFFVLHLFIIISLQLLCQNTFKAVIKDNESKQTLSGVSVLVKSTTKKISSDKNGDLIINDIPNGEQEIEL